MVELLEVRLKADLVGFLLFVHILTNFHFSKGGSLASDDLFLLDLRNGEHAAQWMIVPVVG